MRLPLNKPAVLYTGCSADGKTDYGQVVIRVKNKLPARLEKLFDGALRGEGARGFEGELTLMFRRKVVMPHAASDIYRHKRKHSL